MYALQILFIKLKALSIYLCIAVLCMAPIYVSSNIFAAINICGYFAEMGLTPLHHAAWNGSTEVVRLLLTGRARTDVSDKEGKTPLHHAHLTEVVTLLLTGGARTDVADKEGWTPLHWAAWGGHPEVARLLLAGGARTDVADKSGYTPLHWAAINDQREVVTLLLAEGAQTDVANKEDLTPLHDAAGCGHKVVVSLLLRAGARTDAADERSDPSASCSQVWVDRSCHAVVGRRSPDRCC